MNEREQVFWWAAHLAGENPGLWVQVAKGKANPPKSGLLSKASQAKSEVALKCSLLKAAVFGAEALTWSFMMNNGLGWECATECSKKARQQAKKIMCNVLHIDFGDAWMYLA